MELASSTWIVYEEQIGLFPSQLSSWRVPGLRKLWANPSSGTASTHDLSLQPGKK